MKHTREPQSLPDWFDLAKYSALKSATELEWYAQIVIRRECWDFLHGYNPAADEEDARPMHPALESPTARQLLQLMREYGVARLEDIRRACNPYDWGDHILGELDRLKPSVHPLTIEELYLMRLGLEEEPRKRFDQLFIAELTPEGSSPYMEHLRLVNTYHDQDYENSGIGEGVHTCQKEGMSETGLSTFRVNLRLSDSLLIQQFKVCLRQSRKTANVKTRKTVRRQSTSQWEKFRVLPYIDLVLWMRQTGSKMKKTAVADALFRNGEERDAETVRKTVKPLAMSLLQRHSVPFQQLKHRAARLKAN
jgi:hypothetical protein